MINITQGENKVFTITIRDQDGDPFDLTNFTKYTVCFPLVGSTLLTLTEIANANGSVVALLGAATAGKLQVTLNFVDSATLFVGTGLNIGVILDSAANDDPRPKNGVGVLNVSANPCPA